MLSWLNALILLISGKNVTSAPKIERHVLTTSKLQYQVTNVTSWYLSILSDHDVWWMPVTNEQHVLTTSKLQYQVTNVTCWYLSILSDHDVWRMPVTNERHVLTTSKLQYQVTNVTCWYLSILSDHDVWRMPVTNERRVLTTSKLQYQVTNVTSWYLSILSDHDVWRMPVTNAEDERGDTVPSTGLCERVNGLKVLRICTTGNKQAYRKTSNKCPRCLLEHELPNP